MINNDNVDLEQEENKKKPAEKPTPDENSGIAIQGFFKIFDPESGEILLQGRD